MLRQSPITQWLVNDKEEKTNIPYHRFHLVKEKNNYHAFWTHKSFSSPWKKLIKLGSREIILSSSFPIKEEERFEGSLFDSFLISHLQKAVRRKQSKAALFTCEVLLKLSPTKLFRRLPIIMLEDTQLHKCFHVFVWLMMTKGLLLDSHFQRWIMGAIYILIQGQYFERVRRKGEFIFQKETKAIHSLPKEESQLIYSLEARKVYGGMKGDLRMIANFQHSLLNKRKFPDFFFSRVKAIQIGKIIMTEKDWLYSAYDFHCVPRLLQQLQENFPKYSREDFRAAIWHCSSKINRRKKVIYSKGEYRIITKQNTDIDQEILWNKTREFIRRKAWGYLQTLLDNFEMIFSNQIRRKPRKEQTEEKEVNKD